MADHCRDGGDFDGAGTDDKRDHGLYSWPQPRGDEAARTSAEYPRKPQLNEAPNRWRARRRWTGSKEKSHSSPAAPAARAPPRRDSSSAKARRWLSEISSTLKRATSLMKSTIAPDRAPRSLSILM